MFEGSAANAAAADDADATFDDTALALEVAAGLPATMAPEDCILGAAEIPELVPEKSVLLLDDTCTVCRVLGVTLEAVGIDNDMEMELLVE